MPDPVTKEVGLGGIAVQPGRLRALRPDVVKALMESMTANGLLQPVVLRPKPSSGFWLVAGLHRLDAARKLKWDSIRAVIFDTMEAAKAELAEIDELLIRADLSPIERALHVARRKVLYEIEHPETKKGGAPGKAGGGKKKRNEESQVGTLGADAFIDDTAAKTSKGRSTVARDAKRGNLTGIADAIGTSLDKGDEIDALLALPPTSRDKLIARAKAGEKVSAKSEGKKHKRAQREQQLADKITALPTRHYGVVVADPEWRFEPWSRETGMDRAADNHYPTSCTEVIAARDVRSIAARDCVLFLWATNPMLPHALLVMAAWDFDYVSNYCWGKDKIGPGYWNREKHELLLIGTRGNVPCPAPGMQWDSLILAARGEHSEKPDTFLDMIEEYFPNVPKIELNRRGPARQGWDAWGNEVEEAAE